MATILLYGDTIRYPALRHEVSLAVRGSPEEFVKFEPGDRGELHESPRAAAGTLGPLPSRS